MKAEDIQRRYYAETAASYDARHVSEHDEHALALDHIVALAGELGVTSVLDVGAGTGRAVRTLRERLPGVHIVGVEPVDALIEVGRREHELPPECLVKGDGYALPFAEQSFDFVIETGVLHHVATPRRVVREMTRVARRGVFLSDSNRFGQGPIRARLAKLALRAAGLWPLANLVKTRGRGYIVSEGDGLSYSYSVYDDVPALAAWAHRVYVLPLGPMSGARPIEVYLGPLLAARHVLACALRDPR